MRVPFYDIKAQYLELQDQMDAAMRDVMLSGSYALGPQHNAFERDLADLHAMKHGIAVNSGTDALRIMMDAVGVGKGDEVITTAFTFVASVETIVQTGARPVFVDIDPVTFQMDPAKIEAAITTRTKAILPIHLFGQMADMDRIVSLAQKHNLIVLEDAAQALGSSQNGKAAGQFGSAAGFSFYVTKNLGAAGDGGLILTNDDEIADRCKSMRIHGMGRKRYYYDYLGYTSRLDELQAAIMRVKLTRLTAWNEHRAKVAAIYGSILQDSEVVTPVITPGNVTTWHQYTIRATRRDELQTALKERGIDSMIYYPVPIHFHDPYVEYGSGPGSFPVTELACEEVLCLPIHPHLPLEAAEHVAKTICELVPSKAGV